MNVRTYSAGGEKIFMGELLIDNYFLSLLPSIVEVGSCECKIYYTHCHNVCPNGL